MRTIDYMCQHLSSGVANHAVLERGRLQRARKELSLPVWVSSEYELSALYYNIIILCISVHSLSNGFV